MPYELHVVRTSEGDSPTVNYDREKSDAATNGRLPIGIQLQNQSSSRLREFDTGYRMDVSPEAGAVRLITDGTSPTVDIGAETITLTTEDEKMVSGSYDAFERLWAALACFPAQNGFEVRDPQLGRAVDPVEGSEDRAAVEARFMKQAETAQRAAAMAESDGSKRWWAKFFKTA